MNTKELNYKTQRFNIYFRLHLEKVQIQLHEVYS